MNYRAVLFSKRYFKISQVDRKGEAQVNFESLNNCCIRTFILTSNKEALKARCLCVCERECAHCFTVITNGMDYYLSYLPTHHMT